MSDILTETEIAELHAEVDSLPDKTEIVEEKAERESQTDLVVRFSREQFHFLRDSNATIYAKFKETGELFPLRSRAFKDLLQSGFYHRTKKTIRTQSLTEATGALEAIGRYEGDPQTVFMRIGKSCHSQQNEYYLDLCEPGDCRAICWGPNGWKLTNNPEVLFVRGEAMQPLPIPKKGGDFSRFWDIFNAPEDMRPLVITWLIDSMRPDTPYPGLELIGEQGTGKSTATEAARRLIDPNVCNLRGAPKTHGDIYVTAGRNHIVAFENISHLAGPMQDALCILSTGGAHAKRKLYSDDEEHVIKVHRPWIVNGINANITQQDLIDRTISFELLAIESRQTSAEQWAKFENDLPEILGGLLDIACDAMDALQRIELDPKKRPRMAEYTMLGMAVAVAMDKDPQTFFELFREARKESIARTIDSSPVATAIVDFIDVNPDGTTDSAQAILNKLEGFRPQGCDSWPRSAKGLGDAMRKCAPALRQLDIECRCLGRSGGNYKWSIKKKLYNPSPESHQVLPDHKKKLYNPSPTSPEVLPNDQKANNFPASEGKKQDLGTCRTSVLQTCWDESDKEEI